MFFKKFFHVRQSRLDDEAMEELYEIDDVAVEECTRLQDLKNKMIRD